MDRRKFFAATASLAVATPTVALASPTAPVAPATPVAATTTRVENTITQWRMWRDGNTAKVTMTIVPHTHVMDAEGRYLSITRGKPVTTTCLMHNPPILV